MIDLVKMRWLIRRVPKLLWDIEQKNAKATRITTVITGMPGNHSSNRSQTEDGAIMLVAAKDAYREAIAELDAMRKELAPIIDTLDDPDEKAVARMRYMHGYDPDEIAQAINYHPRTVYRKLKRAERKLLDKSCQ